MTLRSKLRPDLEGKLRISGAVSVIGFAALTFIVLMTVMPNARNLASEIAEAEHPLGAWFGAKAEPPPFAARLASDR